LANDHLVDEDTEGPPIDGLAVALVEQDLRRDVLGRSAERVGARSRLHDFCEAKIGQFEIQIIIKQNIAKFLTDFFFFA